MGKGHGTLVPVLGASKKARGELNLRVVSRWMETLTEVPGGTSPIVQFPRKPLWAVTPWKASGTCPKKKKKKNGAGARMATRGPTNGSKYPSRR